MDTLLLSKPLAFYSRLIIETKKGAQKGTQSTFLAQKKAPLICTNG